MSWPIILNLVGILFLLSTFRDDQPARYLVVRGGIGIALLLVAFAWAR